MKSKVLFFRMFVVFFMILSLGIHANPLGNLRIVAVGSSSTPPFNNWLCGIGVPGTTYTITAADLMTLVTQNAYNLTLNFDTIEISGNVVLNFSASASPVFLSLRTNDYGNGLISFDAQASLKLIAGNGKKSVLNLSAGRMENIVDVTADTIKMSDVTQSFSRIEMNGFKNWIQADIDSLISRATHIGYNIAPKPGVGKENDFTYNTLYQIDSGVFSMTAQQNFLNDSGIGFKNMDRGGTLAGVALGAFPLDTFYVDLSHADGLRFKVNVNGSAERVSIGISNCVTMVFEYFVYDIPLKAIDKDGYMMVPFPLFKKESWGDNWDLSKPIVFIIEVMNITNGTKVSFSDIHAYKLQDKTNAYVQLGNIVANGHLDIVSSGSVSQEKGSRVLAKNKTNIRANGSIILPNPANSFQNDVVLTGNYMFLAVDSNTAVKDSVRYYFNGLTNYIMSNVIVNEVSKGSVNSHLLPVKTQSQHSIEVIFTSPMISFNVTGDRNLCLNEGGILTASGNVDGYSWMFDGEVISQMYEISLPDTLSLGSHRYFITADRTHNSIHYTLTNSILVFVHAPSMDYDTLCICKSELPYTWRDTTFEIATVSGDFIFYRSAYTGCDSTVYFSLTVLESYIENDTLIICENELPYSWRDTLFDVGTENNTFIFYRNAINGCDSIVYVYLDIIQNIADTIGVISGDTSIEVLDNFTYTIPAVAEASLYHWTVEQTDTISFLYVYLDTLISDTFIVVGSPGHSFSVSVRAINACDSSEISTLVVRVSLSVAEINKQTSFVLFPNPNEGVLSIDNGQCIMKDIRLYDVVGKEVKRFQVHSAKTTLDVRDLKVGMYFIKVMTEQGMMSSKIQIMR